MMAAGTPCSSFALRTALRIALASVVAAAAPIVLTCEAAIVEFVMCCNLGPVDSPKIASPSNIVCAG